LAGNSLVIAVAGAVIGWCWIRLRVDVRIQLTLGLKGPLLAVVNRRELWYVNWFVLAAGLFAFPRCKGTLIMFFCYLVSRPFAGVLDSVRNVCAFDLGSFIPLLLFLDCLYTHFGHNMWLDWVRFMSPQHFVLSLFLF
jgi:hypothetical protein